MSEMNIKAVWPDWELQGELGSGAHGKVYLGKQTAPNGGAVYRAIKMIQVPPQKEAIQSAIDLGISATLLKNYFDVFKDDLNWEMTLYRSADSEHLGKSDEFTFVENELEPGWSCYIRECLYTPLGTYYSKTKTGEKEAVQIGKDICNGLIACEKFNLVHGGITPSNIMVDDTGKFLLVDYGINRCLSKAGAKLFKTNKSYDAPEVAADGKHSRQSDIYSLGMTMASIANGGVLPVDGELKNCSREFTDIIKKATAPEVGDRYKTVAEMLADLERVPAVACAPKGTSAVSLALAAVGMSPNLVIKDKKAEKAENSKSLTADKPEKQEKAAKQDKPEKPADVDKGKMSTDDLIAASIIAGASAAATESVDAASSGEKNKKKDKTQKKKSAKSENKQAKAENNSTDAVNAGAGIAVVSSVPPSVAAKNQKAKAKAEAAQKKLDKKKSVQKAGDPVSKSVNKTDAAEEKAKAKAAEKAAIRQNKEAEIRSKREAKESAAAAAAAAKAEKKVKSEKPKKTDIPSVSVSDGKKKKTGLWTVIILLLVLIAAALVIFQPWKLLADNSGNSDKPVIENNGDKQTDDIEKNDPVVPGKTDNDQNKQDPVVPELPVDDNNKIDISDNNDDSDNNEPDGECSGTDSDNNGNIGNNNSGNGGNSGSTGGSSSFKKDYKWATTFIKSSDLAGMSKSESQDIINEIYARNGLIFGSNSSPNQKYFMSKDWYKGTTRDMSEAYNNMNSTEKKNINTIVIYQVDNGFRGDKTDISDKPDTPDEPDSPSKYLAESHTTYLTMEDLKELDKDETAMLINEIYARHGKIFKTASIQSYFEDQDWYTPVTESSDDIVAQFNEYEKANMKLIVQYQKEMGYR